VVNNTTVSTIVKPIIPTEGSVPVRRSRSRSRCIEFSIVVYSVGEVTRDVVVHDVLNSFACGSNGGLCLFVSEWTWPLIARLGSAAIHSHPTYLLHLQRTRPHIGCHYFCLVRGSICLGRKNC